jgi:hypothetical protein
MNSTSYETAKAFTDPEDFIQDTLDFREAFGDDGALWTTSRTGTSCGSFGSKPITGAGKTKSRALP